MLKFIPEQTKLPPQEAFDFLKIRPNVYTRNSRELDLHQTRSIFEKQEEDFLTPSAHTCGPSFQITILLQRTYRTSHSHLIRINAMQEWQPFIMLLNAALMMESSTYSQALGVLPWKGRASCAMSNSSLQGSSRFGKLHISILRTRLFILWVNLTSLVA